MKARWLTFLLIGWLLSGCALLEMAQSASPASPGASAPPAAEILATVNGVHLTRADLNKRIAMVQLVTWLTTGGAAPDLDESQYVDKWVDSELMALAAASAKYTATAGDAEAEITRLLQEGKLNETDLLRQLSLQNLVREDLVQYEQQALAVQHFVDGGILAGASESEKLGRLATWLVRQRGTAKIERPTPVGTAKVVGVYAGAIAPSFKLSGLNGVEQSLESTRGKVVLLNFWATWCGPCRNEMPAIQKAYDTYKSEGFEVWGVNVAETPDQVQAYMKQLGLSFNMVLDSDSKISHQYHVFGLPTSVFLGRDGVIREVIVGEMAENSLDANLMKLVRQ